MISKERNELSELAKELNRIKNILRLERFFNCSEEVDKAQRIIEELAKVEDRRDGETNSDVAELRECLKEAIREKCPFTRMSCKHGEPCDYECGTFKWRKALQDEEGAK